MIRLLLGGVKSGKSALGERLLLSGPPPWRVLATGRALDADFRERIAAHKRTRPPEVAVIEAGEAAMAALGEEAGRGGTILFDSLDFWLFACHDQDVMQTCLPALTKGVGPYAGPGGPELIVVSTEVGLGGLAAGAAMRRFADALGRLNQAVAAMADDVRLVVAGCPLTLKGSAS
ncbi:MAG: bifunctional adenosylcobinamide kinase/adenosylcobinamide-phosphate guanylyltransferase [Solidesulfovibrio sp. DCME]|uniref:bifunctional adenosylcobinamide kinase/adenosylcobinamide-phosphate guanylyltransferase n=1 Tax=Solidesulfovibrio sp. DCME TaxID=3447380 RepID=UPI003D14C7EB